MDQVRTKLKKELVNMRHLKFYSSSTTQLALKEGCKIVHVASATIVFELRAKLPKTMVRVPNHGKGEISAVARILF